MLVAAAESAIDCVTGACGAILACEAVARGFSFTGDIKNKLEEQFARGACLLNERLYKGRPPRISLLAACFLKGRIIYKTVGRMSLVSYDNRALTIAGEPAGQADCRGKTFLLCSQGLWQALPEIEVEQLLARQGHPYFIAQDLIEAVNKKNRKDQKSTVAVIVRGG